MITSFSISKPLLVIGTIVSSKKITIYQVRPTGRKNDYLETSTSVESPLGTFTWREEDKKLTTPVDHKVVTVIDRAKDTDLVQAIAQAITEFFDTEGDNLAAFEAAKQLVEMIAPTNTPERPTL
jgi:hypothetical protein